MHGFFNIDKPAGLTSHDVVARVRRWSRIRQVGHAGTLDPQATGVLPIGIGHGTRLIEFLPDTKAYRAGVAFGVATDTYDAEGTVTDRRDASGLTRAAIEAALPQFIGEIAQRPPIYSAVHHEGARLYELARRGVAVDVPARTVRIDSAAVTAWEPPIATIEVHCGRGTYLRSLAHDLGSVLGCGAHLQSLVRLEDAGFRLEESVDLDRLQRALTAGEGDALLYPLDFPVRAWPSITLNPAQQQMVQHGQSICPPPGTISRAPLWQAERCRGLSREGRLVALLERKPLDPCWHPFKVFP